MEGLTRLCRRRGRRPPNAGLFRARCPQTVCRARILGPRVRQEERGGGAFTPRLEPERGPHLLVADRANPDDLRPGQLVVAEEVDYLPAGVVDRDLTTKPRQRKKRPGSKKNAAATARVVGNSCGSGRCHARGEKDAQVGGYTGAHPHAPAALRPAIQYTPNNPFHPPGREGDAEDNGEKHESRLKLAHGLLLPVRRPAPRSIVQRMVRGASRRPGFFLIEPEVAGGLGENTVIHHDQVPPRVERLHYEFEGWLGDDLVESYPCFVVTRAMGEGLVRTGLTGFFLRDVEVSTSEVFRGLYPGRRLPEFRRHDVDGTPGEDDLGLDERARLVVSEKVLDVLRTGSLDNCAVTAWPDES